MSSKLALAVAVGLALPGIEAAGFDPNIPSYNGRQALVMIYALIPVVIKVLAVWMIWQFPLTAHVQAVIQKRLNGRKKAMTGKRSSLDDRPDMQSDPCSNRT
jgi:Na+/melibiose symporter-like transporter